MRHPSHDDPSPSNAAGHYGHYNPNQPRVPAGHSDGGQWTGGAADEAQKEMQLALAGDPPRPGIRFVVQKAIETGLLALYAAYSQYNNRNQRAILEAKAVEYHREGAPNGEFDVRKFRLLAQQQVPQICPKLEEIQDLTDKAAAAVWDEDRPMSATQYGTEVHRRVARQIGIPPDIKDPNFVAEISLTKMEQDGATPEEIERVRKFGFPYGTKGSVRVDALERTNEKAVCVYDIKTGNGELTPARISEIFKNVRSIYGDATTIIITEVRPKAPFRFSPK